MNKHTKQSQRYRSTIKGHMSTLLSRAKKRAKDDGLPFDIDLEYITTLPHTHCPVLGITLAWCSGSGYRADNAPSLDKINPLLGYTKGNVAWMSWRANRIKNDGTADEHIRIARFMLDPQ